MTPALQDLFTLLRFPSISTDSTHAGDVAECADWLAGKFSSMGLDAEVHPTPGHPVVVARNRHVAGRRTVLIYGHYDVQPVDPLDLWDSAPFEPEIRDGKIWARGATDNKGQLMAHVCGIEESLRDGGELPVNLIFVAEGEEEIGSKHLGEFLEARRDEMACDVIAVSDTGMVAPGVPTLGYGLRGIASCNVLVRGPATDLHSGVYGGAVANPATVVARIVASLHDEKGHIRIPGFYDGVRPLEDWERKMWVGVPGMSEAEILDVTGSPALSGEDGFTSAERLWARPTAEVNGIGGGYQGEGSKTVLPAEAFAKLTFRLVPDQDPADIMKKVLAHLEAVCPPGVTLEVETGHDGKPYIADPHSEAGKAAQRALAATFGREPVLIREGGSIPIICSIHAPNENFPVENFEAGIRLNRELLRELGK